MAIVLWESVKVFVENLSQDEHPPDLGEEQLRLASAALLVRAMVIDGDVDESEKKTLHRVLQTAFEMTPRDVTALIAQAKEQENQAVDLYGFTSVLTGQLDQEGRMKIVEMLWEIVMADGVIHEFEANLVWRVAELLGISSRDRIRLRKRVEQRQLRSVWDD